MKLDELRAQFEEMAESSMFSINRNTAGEYTGLTFYLWAGYWECAVKNGIIKGREAEFKAQFETRTSPPRQGR